MVLQRNDHAEVPAGAGDSTVPAPEADEACHASRREASAFWEVWEHYKAQMLGRRCRHWMGGNPTAAEDALSEACLRAWQGWREQTQPITNIPGWLSHLVHNHCRNLHLARVRHTRIVQSVEDIAAVGAHAAAPGCPSPEDEALHQELGRAIRQAIEGLPPRLQGPARLYFEDDVAYADIAVSLHLTPATVRKRIQHARAQIRTQLAVYLTGDALARPRRRVTLPEGHAGERRQGSSVYAHA